MCNLFRASLYFEEDILNQNSYRGRTNKKKKEEEKSVSCDRYSFIN